MKSSLKKMGYEENIKNCQRQLEAISKIMQLIEINLDKCILAVKLVDRMKNPAHCETFLEDNAFLKHGTERVFKTKVILK